MITDHPQPHGDEHMLALLDRLADGENLGDHRSGLTSQVISWSQLVSQWARRQLT